MCSTTRFIFCTLTLCALTFTTNLMGQKRGAALATAAGTHKLSDQFERSYAVGKLLRGPVILLAGDQRKSHEHIAEWAYQLTKTMGDSIRVVGLLNLEKLPFFVPTKRVRRNLKKQLPTTIVLCDYKGALYNTLGLAPKEDHALLLDEQGRIRLAFTGSPTLQALEEMKKTIKR